MMAPWRFRFSSSRPSPFRQLTEGTVILTAFQFVSKPLLALFFILLGNRILFSEEAYGRLESLLALVNMLLVLSDLGLELFTTRQLARLGTTSTEWLPGQVRLKILLTSLTSLVLVSWLWCFDLYRGTGLILSLWFSAVLLLSALSGQSYLRGISRGHQWMSLEGQMGVVEKIATLILGGVALWVGWQLLGVMLAFALGSLLGAVFAGYGVWRIEPGLRIGAHTSWSVLRQSLPFALSAICICLFYNLDRVMLSFWSDQAVAPYARALRIIMAILLFPQMMSIAIYPILSRLKTQQEERLHVSRKSFRTLMLIAGGFMLGGWLLAGPLMDLLYGQALAGTQPCFLETWLAWDTRLGNYTETTCLRLLLLGLPFTCGNYLFGPALNALDHETWNFYASLIATITCLGVNLLLIPLFGPTGAALATTITQGVYCVGLYRYLRRVDPSWIWE
jgi:O-antigen/teichoic acid export membrane protein